MESCLYEGVVRHRRRRPVEHAFTARLFMVWLDLDELDVVFEGRWFWSTRRAAPACFRREDHLGDPAQSLDDCVRDLVQAETGRRPDGPIRLLTHLRYWGLAFNPASFYYCYDRSGKRVEAVVVEVSNTPWNERHCYVLDGAVATSGDVLRSDHEKTFHVSPFMDMAMRYAWSMPRPGRRLALGVRNVTPQGVLFDASLDFERREMTGTALARALIRFPWLTARVLVDIYWQALRLRLAGVPFHPHPGPRSRPDLDSRPEPRPHPERDARPRESVAESPT